MDKGVFPEYLGDISTEMLLILANTNGMAWANSERIRKDFPKGFTVTGEFEMPVYETAGEQEELRKSLNARLSRVASEGLQALIPPGKKLVRLILEPLP